MLEERLNYLAIPPVARNITKVFAKRRDNQRYAAKKCREKKVYRGMAGTLLINTSRYFAVFCDVYAICQLF
jgi:hypothetical protein